jgi:hypothetical protein
MLRGIAPSALVFTGEQRRSMSPDMIDEIKESRGGVMLCRSSCDVVARHWALEFYLMI